jgi:hypothetical protein
VNRRERDWVLGEFKAGRSPILIATDVASRGLGTFFFSQALGIRFRQTTHGSPTPPWVFTLTFLLPGLRVRIRSKTGLTDNAHRQSRGSLVFAMSPSSLQHSPITFSFTEPRSRVYSNEHFSRSWSAFGYGLRCSRLWDFDTRLLSMPALARKRPCLSTSWTRRGSIMCYPSHVETPLGHPGHGCLMLTVPAVEALVS